MDEWLTPRPPCYKVAMPRVPPRVIAHARRPVLVAFVALVTLLALVLGCVSPTLPLPPPAEPTISLGTAPDTYRLTSIDGAQPNALIIIVNRNETLGRDERVTGTLADARGSWEATVNAKVGDILDISQDTGTTRSPGTTITVR